MRGAPCDEQRLMAHVREDPSGASSYTPLCTSCLVCSPHSSRPPRRAPSPDAATPRATMPLATMPLQRGGELVDAPGRGLVGAKGEYALPCAFPGLVGRDRPCDPARRRRVIVDRHWAAEQPDDEEAGRDDRQRTGGRDASQAPERLWSVRDSTVTVASARRSSARPARHVHRMRHPVLVAG
jgi:hypothetical protein